MSTDYISLSQMTSSGFSDHSEKTKQEPLPSVRSSRVLIVGAGIGGLFLAILLERIGIPYYLFERATQIKPLGSALALGVNILPVFEQLGLTNLLASISLPCPTLDIYNSSLKKVGSLLMKGQTEITGYENLICSRPSLYDLLLSQLQSDNLVLGKKVMSYEENEFGVNVCCSDNTVYTGDLLVGADGAYSRIRQTMQRQLEKKGLLRRPTEKQQQIPNYACMLGVAQPGNPERYRCLKDPFVNFSSVIGGNGLGWNVINIPDDKICWSLWIQLDVSSLSQEVLLQNEEWTNKSNDKMTNLFRKMPCPYGGTMGELIDATPPDLISKVFIEEQLFETWHHGRTVLIGDSCHTMLPGGGQGATNAMQDAVILANCLVGLKDLKPNTIRFTLEKFQEQRYRHARRQYLYSKMISKLLNGQSIWERVARRTILNLLPHSYQQRIHEDTATYRPQVCFLPPTENRGSGYVLPQSNRQYSEDEARARVAVLWGHSDEKKMDIIDGDDKTVCL